MHRGVLSVRIPDIDVTIGSGDIFTLPVKMPRTFFNASSEVVHAYVVRGGDDPLPPSPMD